MAYTFDGPNKLIILSSGTTVCDIKDMYSRWKEWVATSNNSKYLPAMSVLGGDPLPGGRYLGTTYFLENGWKVRPYEGNHTLSISGNIYSRDGTDPFVNTIGSYNVRIMLVVSNLVDTVSTGGVGTVGEVANAVWGASNYAAHGAGTAGTAISASDPTAVAAAVRTELTPELTQIMALQNGLTSAQATMLTELYRIMGLDPSKPLIVTDTTRQAGPEIIQNINSNASGTSVTRV